MFIIHYLPDFVTHLITLIGVAGVMVVSIPFIWNLVPGAQAYRLLLQIVSVVLLGFGLFLEGGLADEVSWKAKVAELEQKVADSKIKSAGVSTKAVAKVLNQRQVIREKGNTIVEYIDREVVKYDPSCPIPSAVVTAHNAAAMNDPLMLATVPTADHNKLATPPIRLAPKK